MMAVFAQLYIKRLLITFTLFILSPARAIAELGIKGLHTEPNFDEFTGKLSKVIIAASIQDKTLMFF